MTIQKWSHRFHDTRGYWGRRIVVEINLPHGWAPGMDELRARSMSNSRSILSGFVILKNTITVNSLQQTNCWRFNRHFRQTWSHFATDPAVKYRLRFLPAKTISISAGINFPNIRKFPSNSCCKLNLNLEGNHRKLTIDNTQQLTAHQLFCFGHPLPRHAGFDHNELPTCPLIGCRHRNSMWDQDWHSNRSYILHQGWS